MSAKVHAPATQAVAISDFKARCLALVERVRRTGRPLLITRHGKPVAEVVPASRVRREQTWIGEAAGRTTVTGDIVSRATDPADWEAVRH